MAKRKKKDRLYIDLNEREKTTLSFVDYELLLQIMDSVYLQGARDSLIGMDEEVGVGINREVLRKIMDRFFIRAPLPDDNAN